jgi:hypothetical protein
MPQVIHLNRDLLKSNLSDCNSVSSRFTVLFNSTIRVIISYRSVVIYFHRKLISFLQYLFIDGDGNPRTLHKTSNGRE